MTSPSTSSPVRRHPALRSGLATGFAGLGLLTLAGCAVDQAQADARTSATTTTESSASSSASSASSTYADGTYAAEATYTAPSGTETISVNLTIADDLVTGVSVDGDATDHEAKEFQERFASGIASTVVGKDIADLSVTRVSGASLTSIGFNTALEQIRSEALA